MIDQTWPVKNIRRYLEFHLKYAYEWEHCNVGARPMRSLDIFRVSENEIFSGLILSALCPAVTNRLTENPPGRAWGHWESHKLSLSAFFKGCNLISCNYLYLALLPGKFFILLEDTIVQITCFARSARNTQRMSSSV